jgi:hypothetical protein
MIKDVHVSNSKRSLLRRSNSVPTPDLSRRASEINDISKAVAAGKVREIAISPTLAIASFVG